MFGNTRWFWAHGAGWVGLTRLSTLAGSDKILILLSIFIVHYALDNHVHMSSGICGQWRPRQPCTSAQSDQGPHCPLKESLDTTDCMNGEQMTGWYFAHAWNESESLHFAHVEGHLSLGSVRLEFCLQSHLNIDYTQRYLSHFFLAALFNFVSLFWFQICWVWGIPWEPLRNQLCLNTFCDNFRENMSTFTSYPGIVNLCWIRILPILRRLCN